MFIAIVYIFQQWYNLMNKYSNCYLSNPSSIRVRYHRLRVISINSRSRRLKIDFSNFEITWTIQVMILISPFSRQIQIFSKYILPATSMFRGINPTPYLCF